MDSENPIFEIRQHSLVYAMTISAILSIIYVVYLTYGLHSPFEEVVTPSLIGDWIYNLQIMYPVPSNIVAGMGSAVLAFKMGQIVSRFNLYGVVSRLPIELYPLLMMGIMINANPLRTLVVSVIVLYSISYFFSSYRSSNCSGQLVSGAILLGLAAMLYPPLIVLCGVVPFVLVLFERTLREVIVASFAIFIVPFAQLYILWFVYGVSFWDSLSLYVTRLFTFNNFNLLESFNWLTILMFAIVLYMSINAIFVITLLDNTVKARRRLKLVATYVIALGLTIFIPSTDTSIFGIIALPVAMLIPVTMFKFNRLVSFIFYVVLFLCGALIMLNVA